MLTCNRCDRPIIKGEKYHVTKRGRHHAKCPLSTSDVLLSAGFCHGLADGGRFNFDVTQRLILRTASRGLRELAKRMESTGK